MEQPPAREELHQQKLPPPHVALLSTPGIGHLFPIVELAKRLVANHGFTATVITFSDLAHPAETPLLASLPEHADGIFSRVLPSISLDDLPASTHFYVRLSTLIQRSVPAVATALQDIGQKSRLVAYVPDFICAPTIEAAKPLSVPSYMFMPSNCHILAFLLHLPTLHATTSCQYRDLPEPLRLPGCVPLRGADFMDGLSDRNSEIYANCLSSVSLYGNADGYLVNSFDDIEPGAAAALHDGMGGLHPRAYAVGPFVRRSSDEVEQDRFGCIEWLDKQPPCSVLFISFGSGGTLSAAQTEELALGLEQSGRRFLWVMRCPSSEASLPLKRSDDPLTYLPVGFAERTRGIGFIVPNWAPQVRILSHHAVAGFLSHCGWNSVLESIVNGLPLIAWPLYAEQKMNAAILVDGIGVAIRANPGEDSGAVVACDIARIVEELMAGETGSAARRRAKELKASAEKAVLPAGSSWVALGQVADGWIAGNA